MNRLVMEHGTELELVSNEPPKDFRVFPFGTISTSKGTFTFDKESAASVMAAFQKQGNPLPIDYEHQSVQDPPVKAPAAGWFVPEVRPDGLYATGLQWTETAAGHLKAREYRFFSPAIDSEANGHINRLIDLALTNLPATRDMTPLVLSEKGTPPEPAPTPSPTEIPIPPPKGAPAMKSVLHALSLKDDASEVDALTAVSRVIDTERQLLSATGQPAPSEALGVVLAWKRSHEQVTQLKDQVAAFQKKELDREVGTLIEDGLKSGRLLPAHREWALALGGSNLTMLKSFLEAATPAQAAQPPVQPPAGGGVSLSAEESAVCQQMRIAPKQMVEFKAASAAK